MSNWFRDQLTAVGLPEESDGWIPLRMYVWLGAGGNVAIDNIQVQEPPAVKGPMEKMVIDTEARAQATEADDVIEYSVEMDQAIALWLIARNTAAIADRLADTAGTFVPGTLEEIEECPHTATEQHHGKKTCLMCAADLSSTDPGPLGTDDLLKAPDPIRDDLPSADDIPLWAMRHIWQAATGRSAEDWDDLEDANEPKDLWDEIVVLVKLLHATAKRTVIEGR